jgi:hypothetical protein
MGQSNAANGGAQIAAGSVSEARATSDAMAKGSGPSAAESEVQDNKSQLPPSLRAQHPEDDPRQLPPPLRAQHPEDDPRIFFASMYVRSHE